MKVLIEAYSCCPGEGSEKGVGWNVIRLLATVFGYELVVITRANNREKIEATDLGRHVGVKWIFVDPPNVYLWIKKRGRIGLRIYHLVWQREMRKAASEYLKLHQVDLLHRLTFGSIVPPSLLADFKKPLVVGPAGGAEMTSPELASTLPFFVRCKDGLRSLLFRFMLALPSTRKRYQNVSVALGATDASVNAFKKLKVREVWHVPQSGCGGDEVGSFVSGSKSNEMMPEGPIRLVTACRLIYWKGLDLAVDAIAEAVEQGVDVNLTILESGPERRRLEKRVCDLGIKDRVRFTGRLSSLKDVYKLIRESDALFHPALNEAFGQAVLESLTLGRQVICLDWAGPGMIVDETCGLKVSAGPRSKVVSEFAEAIASLESRRERYQEIAKNARKRAESFSWMRLVTEVDKAYKLAVERNAKSD